MKKIRPFYSSHDVALLLGVSVSTVYSYNKYSYLGFPHGFKIGDKWRWLPEHIDAWISNLRNSQVDVETIEPDDNFIDNPEKLSRIFFHACELYHLLSRVIDNEGCSKEEIIALLDIINND